MLTPPGRVLQVMDLQMKLAEMEQQLAVAQATGGSNQVFDNFDDGGGSSLFDEMAGDDLASEMAEAAAPACVLDPSGAPSSAVVPTAAC